MKVILFEHQDVNQLSPITLTRPSFSIFCGATTLYDLVKKEITTDVDYRTRPHLQAVTAERLKRSSASTNGVLLLNGALVPSIALISTLQKKSLYQKSIVFVNKKTILGAYLDLKQLDLRNSEIEKIKAFEVTALLQRLKLKSQSVNWHYFEHPWQVIDYNEKILLENLNHFKKDFKQRQRGVFVGKNVVIDPQVIFDTSDGVIIINDGTRVKSMAVLRGPLYIGKQCVINSFAEIKHGACIGDVCKIGGEVEASVFQGYSNKQHYGFLGNSYIGEWINLAGGTSCSDLKNTYGPIKMQGKETTRQFLGCVVGDYSKTSIATAIFTGKVVGVSSFLYGAVTTDVPSFTNAGTLVAKPVSCPVAIAQKIQKIVCQRRNVTVTAAHSKLLSDVYDLTATDRKAAGVSGVSLKLLS